MEKVSTICIQWILFSLEKEENIAMYENVDDLENIRLSEISQTQKISIIVVHLYVKSKINSEVEW